MTINTKKLKRYRKDSQCAWCYFPIMFAGHDGRFHQKCVPVPDYHDVEAYWQWQKDVKKIGRKRVLDEQEKFSWQMFQENVWRREKEQEIIYD